MANHAAGDDFFVYTGGIAPLHVVNAIVDESVEEIDDDAFRNNCNLKSVVCHGRLLKVGNGSFAFCRSLQRVKMPGVKIIEAGAFSGCISLVDVEFSDKLETVVEAAFINCTSLQRVKTPKVKTIGRAAYFMSGVVDVEFGEDLETVGSGAFMGSKLKRMSIPLKDGIFEWNDAVETYTQFHNCPNLRTVDLVGGIHKTVSSLHLESWRNEMNEEIQRINQILPSTDPDEKANEIVQWIRSVLLKIDHFKAEHRLLLKKTTTLLELAMWKAKLAGFTADDDKKCPVAKKAKVDIEGGRKEARITSGADIIIKNVLPYLKME